MTSEGMTFSQCSSFVAARSISFAISCRPWSFFFGRIEARHTLTPLSKVRLVTQWPCAHPCQSRVAVVGLHLPGERSVTIGPMSAPQVQEARGHCLRCSTREDGLTTHPPRLLSPLLQETWFLPDLGLRQLSHKRAHLCRPSAPHYKARASRTHQLWYLCSLRCLALERTTPSASAAPLWGVPSLRRARANVVSTANCDHPKSGSPSTTTSVGDHLHRLALEGPSPAPLRWW